MGNCAAQKQKSRHRSAAREPSTIPTDSSQSNQPTESKESDSYDCYFVRKEQFHGIQGNQGTQ